MLNFYFEMRDKKGRRESNLLQGPTASKVGTELYNYGKVFNRIAISLIIIHIYTKCIVHLKANGILRHGHLNGIFSFFATNEYIDICYK